MMKALKKLATTTTQPYPPSGEWAEDAAMTSPEPVRSASSTAPLSLSVVVTSPPLDPNLEESGPKSLSTPALNLTWSGPLADRSSPRDALLSASAQTLKVEDFTSAATDSHILLYVRSALRRPSERGHEAITR